MSSVSRPDPNVKQIWYVNDSLAEDIYSGVSVYVKMVVRHLGVTSSWPNMSRVVAMTVTACSAHGAL